jgi:UPF0716 protein FxsA
VLGRLLLLFTVVPLIELYLLIQVGELLGAGPTIAIVFVTGLLGAFLARREGGRVMRSWRASMERMEVPKDGVLSGVLVLVGGVLLVTPGVVTDFVGLSLLFPPTRRFVAKYLKRYVERHFQVQTMNLESMGGGFPGADGSFGPQGDVIDVEAEPLEPN